MAQLPRRWNGLGGCSKESRIGVETIKLERGHSPSPKLGKEDRTIPRIEEHTADTIRTPSDLRSLS